TYNTLSFFTKEVHPMIAPILRGIVPPLGQSPLISVGTCELRPIYALRKPFERVHRLQIGLEPHGCLDIQHPCHKRGTAGREPAPRYCSEDSPSQRAK